MPQVYYFPTYYSSRYYSINCYSQSGNFLKQFFSKLPSFDITALFSQAGYLNAIAPKVAIALTIGGMATISHAQFLAQNQNLPAIAASATTRPITTMQNINPQTVTNQTAASQPIASQTATNQTATNQIAAELTTTNRQQIQQIVYDKSFSQAVHEKVWKQKNPPVSPTLNGKPTPADSTVQRLLQWLFGKQGDASAPLFGQIIGLIFKILFLLALLAGLVWIFKNAAVWQAWFGHARRRAQGLPEANIAPHYRQAFAPLWQGLPEQAALPAFVRNALAQGEWLLALSTLYRGTLREIMTVYDLPITRATTEQQNMWLLTTRLIPNALANTHSFSQPIYQKEHAAFLENYPANANPMDAHSPQELRFFDKLVTLWTQAAYGKKLPTTEQIPQFIQTIEQLVSQWDALYLKNQANLFPKAANRLGKR